MHWIHFWIVLVKSPHVEYSDTAPKVTGQLLCLSYSNGPIRFDTTKLAGTLITIWVHMGERGDVFKAFKASSVFFSFFFNKASWKKKILLLCPLIQVD